MWATLSFKKIVIQSAMTRIVVADSAKAHYSSMVQYASWSEIDYLVTDSGLPVKTLEELNKETKVICAE